MEMNTNILAEELLKNIITKAKLKELMLIDENYKNTYVHISFYNAYKHYEILEKECTVEFNNNHSTHDDLGKDGYNIKLTFITPNGSKLVKRFSTWYNNRHRNYGTNIMAQGYRGSLFLNINNMCEDIHIKNKKVLISQYKRIL